jgi:hypothetical protein
MYRPGRLPRPRPVFGMEVDVRQSDVPPSLERSGDPDLCPSDPAAGTPERGEGPRTARPPHPSRPSSRPPLGRLADDFGLNYMLPEVDQFSDAVDSVVVISGTKTPRRLFASVSLGLRWPWSEDRRLSARPVPTSAKYPASRPWWRVACSPVTRPFGHQRPGSLPQRIAEVCLLPTRIVLSYLTDLARIIAAQPRRGQGCSQGVGRLQPRGRCRGL